MRTKVDRRSFLRLLGSTPIGVPATMAALSAATVVTNATPSAAAKLLHVGALSVNEVRALEEQAIVRLASYYNNNPYNHSTNPGGFAGGGHRVNFPQALQDVATVARAIIKPGDRA